MPELKMSINSVISEDIGSAPFSSMNTTQRLPLLTPSDALAFWDQRPQDQLIKPNIMNDNYGEYVMRPDYDSFILNAAKRVVASLTGDHDPRPVYQSNGLNVLQKAYYNSQQIDELKRIQAKLTTAYDRNLALAKAMMAIQEIVRFHRDGCVRKVYENWKKLGTKTTNRDDYVNETLKFSERLERLVRIVGSNHCVGQDVLNGQKETWEQIARDPDFHLMKKLRNVVTNAKKKKTGEEGRAALNRPTGKSKRGPAVLQGHQGLASQGPDTIKNVANHILEHRPNFAVSSTVVHASPLIILSGAAADVAGEGSPVPEKGECSGEDKTGPSPKRMRFADTHDVTPGL